MVRKSLVVLGVVLMVAFCYAVSAKAAVEGKAANVTVTGTVVAVEKDDAGAATKVAIEEGEKKVVVANEGKGKELLALVGKKVKAVGQMKGEDDAKELVVKSFKVIEEAPAAEE